jgi:hypothetical protein
MFDVVLARKFFGSFGMMMKNLLEFLVSAIFTLYISQEGAGMDDHNNQPMMKRYRNFEIIFEGFNFFYEWTINHLMEVDELRRSMNKCWKTVRKRMNGYDNYIRGHRKVTKKANKALIGIQKEIDEIRYENVERDEERRELLERIEQNEAGEVMTQDLIQNRLRVIEETIEKMRRPRPKPPNNARKTPRSYRRPTSPGLVEIYDSFNRPSEIQEMEERLMEENKELLKYDLKRERAQEETLGGDSFELAPIPEVEKQVREEPGPDNINFDPTHHFRNDFTGKFLRSFEQ